MLVLFIGIFGGELIFRACAHMPIFSYPTLRIMISSLFLSSFIAYLLSFTQPIAARIVIGIVVFLTNFYGYLQLGFNNFLGVYMSFGTSSQLGAVVDYIKDFLHSIKALYYTNFIPFLFILAYLIFIEKLFCFLSLTKYESYIVCLNFVKFWQKISKSFSFKLTNFFSIKVSKNIIALLYGCILSTFFFDVIFSS